MNIKSMMGSMAERLCIVIGLLILVAMYWLFGNTAGLTKVSPIVCIQNGTLEGSVMTSRRGREFVAFRGIPYALPPLGELRFEPPKPSDSWIGVRSAKENSDICIQRNLFAHQEDIVGSEDCLYLNIYSPKLPSNGGGAAEQQYPVMIWIHGGVWVAGSGHSELYGPKFLLDHDIILVTIHYRLGPIGFLSTEDLVSPGNQGLKDQVQSIRWVHENIAAFGGDPHRITIAGHSAGGASVHYHMISPLSRGLFHRAISQSGVALSPWAINYPGTGRNNTYKIGKLLGCPTEESTALIDCLKKKDPASIVATDFAFDVFNGWPLVRFGPIIEPDHLGAFLKEHPVQSVNSGDIADVPWLTGTASHEAASKVYLIEKCIRRLKTEKLTSSGAYLKSCVGCDWNPLMRCLYAQKDKGYVKLLDEKFMEIAPITFLYDHTCPAEFKDDVTKSIREFYFGDKKIDNSTRMNLIHLYTDAWVFIPTVNAVRGHLEALSSPAYYYYFAYNGSSTSSIFFGRKEHYEVTHGDDLQYVFSVGEFFSPESSFTEEDNKMVDVMISLWTNFVKSGNPTPEKTPEISVEWKPVSNSSLQYLRIGGPQNLSMSSDLHPARLNFWVGIPYRGNIELTSDFQRTEDEL